MHTGLPRADISLLPIGLLAPGHDKNLYIVACNKNKLKYWKLFRTANTSYIACTYNNKIMPPNSDLIQSCVMVRTLPILNDHEFPEIVIDNADAHSFKTDEKQYDDDTPKRRGRPCKEGATHKRKSRGPTQYNIFMREQMQHLKHIKDTREKMRLIASKWKLLSSESSSSAK